jgi:hypothetical protein
VVINDTLGFLAGRWSLTRSLQDRRSGIAGSFEGTAVLAGAQPGTQLPAGVRAHYQEIGQLRFGCYRGPAQRSLECTQLDNGAVMLHFAGGRPFIDLDLRNASGEPLTPAVMTTTRSRPSSGHAMSCTSTGGCGARRRTTTRSRPSCAPAEHMAARAALPVRVAVLPPPPRAPEVR